MKEKIKKEVKNIDILSYVKIGLLGALLVTSLVSTIVVVKYIPAIAEKLGVTPSTNEGENNNEYDVSDFTTVDIAGLKNVIKSKGTHVVYIGRETCGYCVKFLPVMKEAQEDYKFKTTYFDITDVIDFTSGSISDQESFDYITGLDAFFEENFGSTPMVAIFKDGKFVKGTVGYTDLATYSKFLEANGIKK